MNAPLAGLSLSGSDALTILISVLGSSVVAAAVAGLMSRSTERQKQLREQMLDVAGTFAESAMEALARIRDYKPTKRKADEVEHRNDDLLADRALRADRHDRAEAAIDCLRPLRGRVHLAFAAAHGPETEVLEYAGDVIQSLRTMLEVSTRFWDQFEQAPAEQLSQEEAADEPYHAARVAVWKAIYGFCDAAGDRMRSP